MTAVLLDTVTFWEVVAWMAMVFVWTMVLWMFIAIFADIMRRRDLSGIAKAFWIFAIFILPLFGILIYMIGRPKGTEADIVQQQEMKRAAGYSSADEIAQAQALLQSGAISQEEFEQLKQRALA